MTGDERTPGPSAGPEDSRSRNHAEVEKPRDTGILNLDGVSQPPPAPGAAASGGAAAPGAPRVEPQPVPPTPVVEGPSPEIALAQDASPLPGAHRGGFHRLPTAPVPVTVQSAPAEPGTEEEPPPMPWAGAEAEASGLHRGLAGWALAFAIVGLAVSLFVGWGFPIGIVAVVSAILALRRPLESRAVAVWAIAIGTVSILYSAGWLLYAGWRTGLLG